MSRGVWAALCRFVPLRKSPPSGRHESGALDVGLREEGAGVTGEANIAESGVGDVRERDGFGAIAGDADEGEAVDGFHGRDGRGLDKRAAMYLDAGEAEIFGVRYPFVARNRLLILAAAGEEIDAEKLAGGGGDIKISGGNASMNAPRPTRLLMKMAQVGEWVNLQCSMRTPRMPPELSLPMPMQAKMLSPRVQPEMRTSSVGRASL
jgi:hypothetical protein